MSNYFSRTVALYFKDFVTRQGFTLISLNYNENALDKSTKALQLLCFFGEIRRLRYHGSGRLKASITHVFSSRLKVKFNQFTGNKFVSISPASKLYVSMME